MNYNIHINTYYYHTYTLHKALFHKHINFNLERMGIFDWYAVTF